MSAGPKPPNDDDDDTTSTRAHLPTTGRVSTRRGLDPSGPRMIPTGLDEPDDLDGGATRIDPEVPTGLRGRPHSFDPVARIDDNRRTVPRLATAPVGEGLNEPPPLSGELNEHGARSGEVNAPPSTATVIGKRAAKPTIKHASGPRAAPVPPVDPSELPGAKPRSPGWNPHARIDDSSRTTKWEAPQIDEPAPMTPRPPVLPLAPGPRSEPLRVVSMKTPQDLEEEKQARSLPEVRLRAMSDVHQTPARGMGFLAPPHDPREARSRRRRDFVIWGSVAVIVAAVVMLAVWFIAR